MPKRYFLTTNAENMYLSSSLVRQIASFGGDISGFVPEENPYPDQSRLKPFISIERFWKGMIAMDEKGNLELLNTIETMEDILDSAMRIPLSNGEMRH